MLLNAGADVNARGGLYGNALEAAVAKGPTKTIQILLTAGADVNAQAGGCGNALEIAVFIKSEEKVQYLLRAGADFERIGRFGTPATEEAPST